MTKKPKSIKAKAKTKKNPERIINATLVKSEQVALSFRILEFKEMQAIEAEDGGRLADAFAYEFEDKQGVHRGIRAVGAREAVRFSKIPLYNFIPEFKYDVVDLGDGWYREIVACKNPKTGEITTSSAQWKRGDRFSDRTARTIAERNALIKQIPAEIRLKFINYCVRKKFIAKVNVDPDAVENAEIMKALPPASDTPASVDKTKKIAAIYATIGDMKIDAAKARIWIHKRYKVASIKDLDDATLEKIRCGLRDIKFNVPGNTAKPKSGTMTPDELKAEIEGGKYDKE